MSIKPPDLDLHFPTLEGPGFPPPRLKMEDYVKFVGFCRQLLIEDGTLETVIANRSRPSEEMFVLP